MLPMLRRLFRTSANDDDAKKNNGILPDAQRDKRAIHESIFKSGQLPPRVPPPIQEKRRIDGYGQVSEEILTNVFIPILAAPGVGVRSFVNKSRYGHMDHGLLQAEFAIGPPQYLCDGNVYSVGLAKLPLPHLLKSGFAVESKRMALVLAFAVDDASSVEEAKDLYRRLTQSFKLKSPGKSPLPFPAMLLGMKADLRPSYSLGGSSSDQNSLYQQPTNTDPETQEAEDIFLDMDEGPRDAAKKFAKQNGLVYDECSAKTGYGMLTAIAALVEKMEAAAQADPNPEETLEAMRNVWIPTVSKIMEHREATDLALPGRAVVSSRTT
ncbi:uncharacterized protein PgNI_02112 [Pyricularia grisea]|uniref:Uncharacterized protein n=1 Tax=Pyricularia grisea TaxID=148305 RepID=A0A6P8BIY7_PYRGI|nr:uncharacterized protein PgNI_02112 [Pyricularia grisea]TLD16557.1 hypothetical protein PgNI_02112 [Pyricularia grisea]